MSDSQKTNPDPSLSTGGHSRMAALVAAVAISGLLFLFWSYSQIRQREENQKIADQKQREGIAGESNTNSAAPAPPVTRAGYVGIQACEACHAQRVKEFKQTRHFLACTAPNPDSMPAAFSGPEGKLTTAIPGLHFEMIHQGDQYLQKTVRQITGRPPQVTLSPISLVYGQGGVADQVYFGWRDNRLFELPVARLLPQNEWATSKFDRNGEGDFSREATPRCLECHNVWFKHAKGTMNVYDRNEMHLGVTCEKCHGPAEKHVSWHKANPSAKSGKEIIHPGHLARESLMAVCGQCHSNAAKYAADPFTYIPGEPLDKYFKTLQSRYPEDEHVANQDKYLRQSKCYQQSEAMTCVTCHNPHHPEPAGTPARQKTCLACHTPDKCTDRPNLPAEVRDDCIGCHMPHVNKVQVHFFTAKDSYVSPAKRYEHKIGVYPLQRQEMLLTWRRTKDDPESKQEAQKLEQELSQKWLAQGDELQKAHRFLAAIDAYRQAERFRSDPQTQEKIAAVIDINSKIDAGWFAASKEIQQQKFSDAARTLEGILELKPDLAMAHGKLGTVYASLGDKQQAREHLAAVSKHDPDEPYGESMLGWLSYLDGKDKEAIEHYQAAEKMEPRNIKVKYNRGLAHLSLQQWAAAGGAFSETVAIDPNHAGAYQGLSHALRGTGQKVESLDAALRAAELTKYESLDILISLADAYAELDRIAEAKATANRALAAAKGNPQIAAQISAKIEAYDRPKPAPK